MQAMGVTVLETISGEQTTIGQWLESGQIVTLETAADIDRIVPKILSLANTENVSSSRVEIDKDGMIV